MSRFKHAVLRPVVSLGSGTLWLADLLGGVTLMFLSVIRAMFPPRFDRRELWRNLYKMGVKSYVIVCVTAFFIGAIMAIQAGVLVKRTGADSLLGWGSGLAVFSELGPVFIGLMFSGRVGANNTAELGTMVVTEQVSALRALAIDPIRYLVVPRFLSMILMLALLTVLGNLFALIGGALTSQVILSVHWEVFLDGIVEGRLTSEFLVGIFKAGVFGFVIAVVSCHYGLTVRGGARGVGRAVNDAVVAAAMGIFIADYFLAILSINMGWI